MPEKPKKGRERQVEPPGPAKEDDWSEDQKSRPYYYDDACGYEKYVPESDEDDRDEEENEIS